MFSRFKIFFKNLLGPHIFGRVSPFWHGSRGLFASARFGLPSRHLQLIGITGTKGKTSTTILTARLLNQLGFKTGFLTTALIFDGQKELQNPTHMSTIDPWQMQKFLNQCHQNDCQYVVLELSSQGLEQNRHWGLGQLQTAAFLNIYPEHIQAHGSWDNYRSAKSKIFKLLKSEGTAIASGELKMRKNTDFMLTRLKSNQKQILVKKITQNLEQVGNAKNNLTNSPTDTNFSANLSTKLLSNKAKSYQYYDILEDKKFYKTLLWVKDQVSSEFLASNVGDLSDQNLNLESKKLPLPTKMVADYELTNLAFALTIVQSLQSVEITSQLIAQISNKVPGRMDWLVIDNEIVGQ